MSNDLISRSALMQSLRKNVLVDVTPNLEQAIAEQPTAYDVDKVVEQIGENTDFTTGEDGTVIEEYVNLKVAKEIVKSGGIE